MDASTAYESRSIKVLRYAIIAVALLAVMLPILWILVSSLKPSDEIFQIPPQYIPREVTLEHYNALFADTLFVRYIINSVIVATLTTISSVTLAVFAGYGWGKYTFTGAKTSSLFILMSQLFPAVVVIIPLFEMLKWLSLLNSHAGLILAYMLLTLPVTTWMLKGFFENIPDNILVVLQSGLDFAAGTLN